MTKFTINTQEQKEVVDLTEKIQTYLNSSQSGLCHIHITHTTAGITTADLDPGTDEDMLRAYSKMLPDLNYNHPHDPSHVRDHLVSSLVGNSVTIPLQKGELILGTWQRVILVEMNGPRDRQLILNIIKTK